MRRAGGRALGALGSYLGLEQSRVMSVAEMSEQSPLASPSLLYMRSRREAWAQESDLG